MVCALSSIIPILIVIFIISRLAGGAKKVQNGRPGQRSAAPASGGRPASREAGRTVATPPGPVKAQPLPVNPEPVEEEEEPLYGMLDDSDRARDDLSEGDSRECDHGSVGGSMDITTHMGRGEEFEHAETRVKVNVRPSAAAAKEETTAAARPIPEMSAEEMRQAVIMAEILKRPSERFAGRRWAAR